MAICIQRCGLAAFCGAVLFAVPAMAGTWTKVSVPAPAGKPANMTLLTDGRVLLSGLETSTTWDEWWTLTPDSTGSYENGSYASVGSSQYGRIFNPSYTLNTGQYMVCGGEYICPASNITCNGQSDEPDRSVCELFDPVSNSWTELPDMPAKVDDTPGIVLADGLVLNPGYDTGGAYTFSPVTGKWTSAASYNETDMDNEAGSALLPDGSVFMGNFAFGRYNSIANSWSEVKSTATIPGGTQYDEFLPTSEDEIGAFLLLYDGTLLVLGGNSKNGLYSYLTDSWALTDATPSSLNQGDAPGCVESDGRVL
ncbi:MAG TPA: hypothetical protein VG713_05320, partial [Pirellulales bacterium]|nr:hypothetical protein [Pirellulales bacterium]